jgi:predicted PurR-regulated permease PerM
MDRQIERYAQLAALVALVVGCFLVLQPFVTGILFAAVICSSTWPLYLRLRARLGGRSTLAALLMSAALVVLVVAPLALLATSLAGSVGVLVDWIKLRIEAGPIEPPAWIASVPLAGGWLDEYWHRIAGSRDELLELARRLLDPGRKFVVAAGGVLAQGLLQMTLTAFVAFFFYRDGEAMMARVRTGMAHLVGGGLGGNILDTVRSTSDGVVYGLLGTAIAQGLVAGIGFVVAGVPAAAVLGAATFVLSLVPMGPPLIWGGAALWLFQQGQTGWAIFMVLYGALVVSSIDNFIKPLLISRGASMPLALVLLGVLGGVIVFGFVGLFLGPVFLAVGYALLLRWTAADAAGAGAARKP